MLQEPDFGYKFHRKGGKVIHQSATTFYKNTYRIDVKYPELPMIQLAYNKNPIPAELLNIVDKSRLIEKRRVSAKVKYNQPTSQK